MAEDWAAVAAEVEGALAEVGFAATITRASAAASEPQNPWDAPASPANAPTVYSVIVVDDGIKDRYAPGGLVTRRVRVLTVAATGVVPVKSDIITVRGQDHVIQQVMPLAPGGVDLLFEVELAA
jgi:hypothetical protein